MVSKFTLFKLKGKTMLKRLFFITSLFLAACSTVEDVPLPVTSSSEKALELYNEALEYQSKWEGREARQKMAAALRIDPNFILANLYAGADEASLVRQSHDGYQLVHGDKIFVFYGYNEGSLTHPIPSSKHGHVDLPRSDMQLKEGYYVKVSLDNGRTFEKDRSLIPIRRTNIDRRNPFGGDIMGMFCCDKPSIIGDSVYFAFQKTKDGCAAT